MVRIGKKIQRGFTLIELMIVVAIIGILAAVAIPAFMQYINNGKSSEATIRLNEIGKGMKSFYVTQAGYPGKGAAMRPATNACANASKQFDAVSATQTTIFWTVTAGDDFDLIGEVISDAFRFNYGTLTSSATAYTAVAAADLNCSTASTAPVLSATGTAGLTTFVMVGSVTTDAVGGGGTQPAQSAITKIGSE